VTEVVRRLVESAEVSRFEPNLPRSNLLLEYQRVAVTAETQALTNVDDRMGGDCLRGDAYVPRVGRQGWI
jgi:hypothetical protein